MLLEERPSRGLRSPRTPTRGIAPGPFLRRRKLFLPSSFRMKLKDPKREPTGAMKTKKKPVEKACFLSRLISFVFPGCTASGRRCFTPPSPWAGASGASSSQRNNLPLQRGFCVAAVPHPTRKVSIAFFQRGFCVAAVPHPTRKHSIILCERVCACYAFSPGICLFDANCNFRKWVQGQ